MKRFLRKQNIRVYGEVKKLRVTPKILDDKIIKDGLEGLAQLNGLEQYFLVGGIAVQSYIPTSCRRPTSDIDTSILKPLNYRDFLDITKRVKEFMIRDLTAVSPDATLRDAAKILARRRLAGLPVVDESQKLAGFISEADIIHSIVPSHGQKEEMFLRNFAEMTRKLSQVGERKVRDHMTEKVESVSEDDDIYTLADLLLGRNYKSLPVVREGRLVGIVSRAEVCRVMMEEKENDN